MKKSLLSVLVGSLILTACQSSPLPLSQPLAPVYQNNSQALSQSALSQQQTLASPLVSTPQIAAPVRVSAPRSNTTSPSANSQPLQSTVSQQSVPQQPLVNNTSPEPKTENKTEVIISQNYNVETLLAGLVKGAGEAEAKRIATKYGLSIERMIESIGTVVYRTQGQNVPELLTRLSQEPLLDYVEADQVATQKPETESEITESFNLKADPLVNDSYFDQQFGLTNMRVPEAWALSQGENIVVAVIDTGVETSHSDLDAQLVAGFDAFSHREGKDAGDVSKLNYFMDSYKHGTHVAGIIAAETNNNRGIAGIAPKAKIMPIKIFPDFSDWIQSVLEPAENADETIISVLADGIVWAVDHGADVINMSLSVTEKSATLDRAVAYALEQNVVVVVAAGNQRHLDNARNELAAIDGVIAVGSVDKINEISFFSNSGDYVAVAAPGQDIISTVPSFLGLKGYINMTGTSMAAPQVAGIAALMRAKYGKEAATPAFIKQRLQETALDKGDVGRDDLYGYGVVDAYKALGGE